MSLLDDVAGRFSEDVTFHSPVATYHGLADVSHLFATIRSVAEDVQPVRSLDGDGRRVTFLTLRVAGHEADGVLEEVFAGGGEIVELRLMLRPLESLLAAVRAMGEALALDPLPSQRGGPPA